MPVTVLNFNVIDTHDFRTLGILDTSMYNPDMAIEEATFEITVPGSDEPVIPFYMPQALNVFNSQTLGITARGKKQERLPDGIWKARYSICPNDKLFIERFFLKTDIIQCKFNQAFLNLDFSRLSSEEEIRLRKLLSEIELYIEGAIVSANRQDTELAMKLYKKADQLLDNYFDGPCGC